MKYPIQLGTIVSVFAGLMTASLLPSTMDARIGERRESIERRLFSSGGIVYRDDTIKESRRKGMPYSQYLEYLPSSSDVRIYFKTSDGRRPSSSELNDRRMSAGWDLHVVFVNGKSAIEVYKRSQGMTEQEFNRLMAIHASGSFWKRLGKEDKDEMVSAFGFEMVRDDGLVRARKLGRDSVLFFDTEIDVELAEMKTSDLQKRAPVSVNGF
ncbi:MAG: hypothetical protein VX372_02880 [Verrucomicrobiota bacterium]|nr:hypothetical protein [Verrucomicrobiota bacterium]MEE2988494.1 hypothetical protein [Verrucomicrobiota bacterium]